MIVQEVEIQKFGFWDIYIDVTRSIGAVPFLGSKSNLGQGAKVWEWLLPQKQKNHVLVYMAPVDV